MKRNFGSEARTAYIVGISLARFPRAGLMASSCAGSAATPTSRTKRSPHRRWPTSTRPLNSACLERTGQLMQAEEALRQSQKMEAVGQLTGGIAHDFNNLLQGILGALDIVKRRIAEGRIGDLDPFLNGALDSANRAATLTHRLLAFSRRQPVDPRPVDLNELIGTVEELLRRSLGENIDLRVAAGEDLWLVRCDGNQLENALLNLAINARDAMPNGGTVTIDTANKVFDARQARRRDVSPGEYVCLRVSDTGVGMPPSVKARAFDPFYTTKPIGKGTGLGLSMIYGFVRQSDGSVLIDSEPGKGTSIEICLPRYKGDVVDAPVAGVFGRQSRRGQRSRFDRRGRSRRPPPYRRDPQRSGLSRRSKQPIAQPRCESCNRRSASIFS